MGKAMVNNVHQVLHGLQAVLSWITSAKIPD